MPAAIGDPVQARTWEDSHENRSKDPDYTPVASAGRPLAIYSPPIHTEGVWESKRKFQTEEAIIHGHSSLYLIAIALVSALLTLPCLAQQPPVGPLIELSRPNAVGSCNDGFNLFGTWPTDDTEEPFVAVNPVHPNNIVAAWIQGPFQDIIAAVSFDGGHNWQRVPIPLTICSGGSYLGAGDPWLSFAPNGDLYAIALAANTSNELFLFVTKSSDGGLHWSTPTLVSSNLDLPVDHPSITADPTDSSGQLVYAI